MQIEISEPMEIEISEVAAVKSTDWIDPAI